MVFLFVAAQACAAIYCGFYLAHSVCRKRIAASVGTGVLIVLTLLTGTLLVIYGR